MIKNFVFLVVLIISTQAGATQVVKIIASDSIPPYVMGDEPLAKELPGLQVEIINAAFAQVKLKTSWSTMPNNRIKVQYKAAPVDAALNLPDISDTQTYASDALVKYRNCIIGHSSLRKVWRDKASELKILGFQGARFVFEKNFAPGTLINNKKYNEVPSQKTIAYHAVHGRADLVFSDALVFAYYAHTYFGPQYQNSDLVCLHEQGIERHLGFKKKSLRDQFNRGLESIHQNGIYDALIHKYRARFSILGQLESSFNLLQLPVALK